MCRDSCKQGLIINKQICYSNGSLWLKILGKSFRMWTSCAERFYKCKHTVEISLRIHPVLYSTMGNLITLFSLKGAGSIEHYWSAWSKNTSIYRYMTNMFVLQVYCMNCLFQHCLRSFFLSCRRCKCRLVAVVWCLSGHCMALHLQSCYFHRCFLQCR